MSKDYKKNNYENIRAEHINTNSSSVNWHIDKLLSKRGKLL